MSTLDTTHVVDSFLARNATFAETHEVAELPLLPTGRTIILGCVDPRVDPALVIGLGLGETAVIRNIGGRVTPATLRTIALLGAIAHNTGTRPGDGWNLVLVHHTDCGITRLLDIPDALAAELGVSPDAVDPESISDPRASLAADIAVLRANPLLPGALIVSGLLYDTTTGRLETVVAPRPLGAP